MFSFGTVVFRLLHYIRVGNMPQHPMALCSDWTSRHKATNSSASLQKFCSWWVVRYLNILVPCIWTTMTLLPDVIHSIHKECSKSKLRKLHWKTTLVWVFAVSFANYHHVTRFYLQADQPGFACQKRVWRESTFPDLNHFCQAKNYQLFGKPDSALMVDHSSQMFPGNKQLIKAAWNLLYLLIHHFFCGAGVPLSPPQLLFLRAAPCSPFFSPLPIPWKLIFHIFLPIWCSHSDEHISAHQCVLLSVRALKMSHTALFSAFFFFSFLSWQSTFFPASLPLSYRPSSLCL